MSYRALLNTSDPIFALATGSLPCAVAVLRISGKDVLSILSKVFLPSLGEHPSRGMYFGQFVNPGDGQIIDSVLLLVFRGPSSFTGEDCFEVQCHGSKAVVEAIQEVLRGQGVRPAEKGEFTYRAWSNGKLTLEAIETLGDLYTIDAPRQLSWLYARRVEPVEKWLTELREELLRVQAILETAVDFPEEYGAVLARVHPVYNNVQSKLSALAEQYHLLSARTFSPRIVLAGKPNAGKSSVFNLLLSRHRSLVHSEAGTTRDVVEEDITLNGSHWKLGDTAGLRTVAEQVEAQGIELGRDYIQNADVILWVVDGSEPLSMEGLRGEILQVLPNVPPRDKLLVIWNKGDKPGWRSPPVDGSFSTVSFSAQTGEGLPELRAWLLAVTEKEKKGDIPIPSQTQVVRLQRVLSSFKKIEQLLAEEVPAEYLAEENRLILQSLGEIVGPVTTEEILTRIFNDFCIGK